MIVQVISPKLLLFIANQQQYSIQRAGCYKIKTTSLDIVYAHLFTFFFIKINTG